MTIKTTLERAKLSQSLVSVYYDSDDWSHFSVGYVDLVTASHVRLRAVSRYGEPAGFEIRELPEVCKVEQGGKYEKKIEKLVRNKGQVFKEVGLKDYSASDLFRDALRQSLEDSVIIVVWGNDDDDSSTGYVEDLEAESFTLRLINQFGENDGFATMSIDEIICLDFNTRSEQMRKFLHDNPISD